MHKFEALKKRQRADRDKYSESLGLRIHRALSWLNRAEQCEDDDGRFIVLWIAFNAAYAQNIYDQERTGERTRLAEFLDKIVDLDHNNFYMMPCGFSSLEPSEFSCKTRLYSAHSGIFREGRYKNLGVSSPDNNQCDDRLAKYFVGRCFVSCGFWPVNNYKG